MSEASHECTPQRTPRERLSRALALVRRARRFWRSASLLAAVGLAVALAVAVRSKRAWRSETTVLFRDTLPGRSTENAADRSARLGPKLKDLVYARPALEAIVRDFDLFPEKRARSMVEAVEEMQTAIGFHARPGDSYVISFTYEDPATTRDVTARLADRMIAEYDRESLSSAILSRDFLRRRLDEANTQVGDASRALAVFLSLHKEFQWGTNDSPYAPTPTGIGAAIVPGRPGLSFVPGPSLRPSDPTRSFLERELSRVEAELSGAPGNAPVPETAGGAQKAREAAAAALAAAEANLREKLRSVTAAHPDAVAARAEIEAQKRALAQADAALSRSLQPGHAAAGPGPSGGPTPARRAELEKERASLRRRLVERRPAVESMPAAIVPPSPAEARAPKATASSDVVELETEWHRLRLELERARDEVRTLEINARAAELSADAVEKQGREEMKILEPAYLPARPDRGRGRVFFLGAAIALFVTAGYAGARVLLDDTVIDEGDVEVLGAPTVLAAVPGLVQARPGEVDVDLDPPEQPERGFEDPELEVLPLPAAAPVLDLDAMPPAALGALRVLRHRLEQRRGEGSLVVSILSAEPGAGKTALAAALALTAAESSRARVALVEANFAHPGAAAALGVSIPPEASFSAQIKRRLAGRGAPWAVARASDGLTLLAEPGAQPSFGDALHATHFAAAIATLRRSHDLVIIDGPAVLGSGDANELEAASDGLLVVVRAGVTRGTSLTRALRQLGDRRVLGIVMT